MAGKPRKVNQHLQEKIEVQKNKPPVVRSPLFAASWNIFCKKSPGGNAADAPADGMARAPVLSVEEVVDDVDDGCPLAPAKTRHNNATKRTVTNNIYLPLNKSNCTIVLLVNILANIAEKRQRH